MTAIPIDIRLSAPAPRASAIGSVPRIVASVVIRIGRNRAAAASLHGGERARGAGCAPLVRELDDQDAVLRHEADEHDQADLREDVQRLAEVPEREQCAGKRQRHGEQDHERVAEALELRGEHQVDQHEREHEHPAERRRALDEIARGARERGREALVERLARDRLERGDALAQAFAPRRACPRWWRRRSGCSAVARAVSSTP